MIFSPIGQYAIRIMTVVAQAPLGERVRSSELASQTHVPGAYLSKVCRRLTAAGLLQSKKGHHGGFSLARDSQEITFDDILRAVDAMPKSNVCAFGWGPCEADNPCPLHTQWATLSSRIIHWARHNTLADVDATALDNEFLE